LPANAAKRCYGAAADGCKSPEVSLPA